MADHQLAVVRPAAAPEPGEAEPYAAPAIGIVARVPEDAAAIARILAGAEYAPRTIDAEALGDPDAIATLECAVLVLSRPALRRAPNLGRLRASRDELPVVVVSRGRSRQAVRDAVSAGADAYVDVEDADRDLPVAIEAALAGFLCVPRAGRRAVAGASLSHREREVLVAACRGMTNQQIADELFLSPHTVKSHLASGFRKLGVNSRAEAAALLAARRAAARAAEQAEAEPTREEAACGS